MAQSATAVREREIPGVVPMDDREIRQQRVAVLILALLPLAGFLAAIFTLWGRGIGPVDVVLLVTLYLFTGLGITVGYHRLLTHRAFDAPMWVKGVFAVAGSMAIEGSVIGWVSDHRRHHAYADKDGDPHSPHLDDGVVAGLWHAHFGWLFKKERSEPERWARDLTQQPTMRAIDRSFGLIVAAGLILPAVLGYAFTGSLWGAVTGFLWGGLARVFLLNHVTFSINSICHFFGSRPYETSDYSTNNWPLSLISFGESWHNNHHAFPSSAFHGLRFWQVDLGGLLIRTLQALRLARKVKRPTPVQIASRS